MKAQDKLEFKLQLLNDTCWGVYVKPVGVSPTSATTTASGQVTVVMPNGYDFSNLTSVSGQWINNASVYGPDEVPDRQFISFGLLQAEPLFPIELQAGQERLLFTFCSSEPCPDSLYLIDCRTALASGPLNDVCPFCPEYNDGSYPHNSEGSNPANDLATLDFGQSPPQQYNFQGNYALSAWSCHDCDGDHIPNALEDTNGNGVHDIGLDSSGICDPCDPFQIQSATLYLAEEVPCDFELGDTAYLAVDIEVLTGADTTKYNGEGWAPYLVVLNDGLGSGNDSIFAYHSGEAIPVVPQLGNEYTLVAVLDSFLCSSPDSLFGEVSIDVEGVIEIVSQPEAVLVCGSESAQFSTIIETDFSGPINYRWQESQDGGVSWADILGNNFSGEATTTLTVSDVDYSMDGYVYRLCIIPDGCNPIYSESALLDVKAPLSFVNEPDDFSICNYAGSQAYFEFIYDNPDGDFIHYYWQQSCDNGLTWTDLVEGNPYNGTNGVNDLAGTGDTLSISDLAGLDDCLFRVGITNLSCPMVYSVPATLDLSGQIQFTDISDEDLLVCSGADTMIFVCADAIDSELRYYWEMSANGWSYDSLELGVGGSHADLFSQSSNGEMMTGGCDTLFIHDVYGLYDYKFRAVAVSCMEKESEEVQLRVEGPLFVLEHPEDVVECAGNYVTFSALIGNPGFSPTTYQWQISVDNGLNWIDLTNNPLYAGVNTSHLVIADVTGMLGYQFRLAAKSGTCTEITTEAATLTSEGPILYSQADDPQDVTLCYDDSFSFTSDASLAQAGTLEYQWQVTSDDGVNFSDINAATDGGNYSGFNTNTLIGNSAYGLYNRCYRLAFTTGECSEVYSNMACLNVQGELSIIEHPEDIVVCDSEPVTFTFNFQEDSPDYASDSTHVKMQWQESLDNGGTWEDLADGLIINGGSGVSGAQNNSITVVETENRSGNLFRALIWTDVCDTLYSEPATFSIQCFPKVNHKLGYNSVTERWNVYISPNEDFHPTDFSELTSGRLTIVGSSDFVPSNVISYVGGDWEPGATLLNAPENPGMNYFTFDLEIDGELFEVQSGEEIILFSFKNNLDLCPDSLYILRDFKPALIENNELVGISNTGFGEEEFLIGDAYGENAWQCDITIGGNGGSGIDSLGTGGNGSAAFSKGGFNGQMLISPNPTSGFVEVDILTENNDSPSTIKLLSLQGHTLQTHLAVGRSILLLDLNHLPAGLYFLAWETNGEVVQREKLIKK